MDIVLENGELSMESNSKETTSQASALCTATSLFPSHDMVVEPIRKAVPSIAISPKDFKSPVTDSKYHLNRYLTSHNSTCVCNLCKNPIFQMVLFQMGVLRARHYYIIQDFATARKFFEAALVWWNKLDNIYLKLIFRDISFWMLMYYVNSLRRARDYDNALQICDISMKHYEQYDLILDVAHFQNAVEQKTSVEYVKEKGPKTVQKSNDINAKKCLRFSPLNVVQEKNAPTHENLNENLPKLEENNNEDMKQSLDEAFLILESPEVEIKVPTTRRRRKLQDCESSSNRVNSAKDSHNAQTPPYIFEKKENNQRKRLTEKKGEKTSTNTKQKEKVSKDESGKITRPRRKRV